jgi:NADH-quinone oxidoreductase subunit J
MSPVLFWLFSALMLGFGLAVVINRNPVASALSLVVSFLGLAALFVSLDAFFIGTIQVLVYAGAVMVLFLFIIMLLDLKAERRRKFNKIAVVGGLGVSVAFAAILVTVLSRNLAGNIPLTQLAQRIDDVPEVGRLLFSNYNLPFQIVGVILLVASVGVVVLSKRELK